MAEGKESAQEDLTGKKTGWQWLELLGALAIPVVLAIAGYWFTMQQDARQQAIEDQRAQREREIEEQRAQDEALQAYLDQMSTLLMNQNLRQPDEDSGVRILARARTLTVLGRLDARRKTQALQFLTEAKLISSVDGEDPIVRLSDADLSDADLSGSALGGADLSDADLSDAELRGADLTLADGREADLSFANLSFADLSPLLT